MQDNNFMQQFEQECKKLAKRDVDEMKKMVEGRGKVTIPPKKQMEAFMAMTADELDAEERKRGTPAFNAWIGDMVKRQRRMKNANLPS